MKIEEDAWRKAVHEGPDAMDRCTFTTTTAVELACEDIGLHPRLVKWSILSYADRNKMFRKDFRVPHADETVFCLFNH